MFQVGQQVRFVGRKSEIVDYHPDYAQLMGHVGVVVDVGSEPTEPRFKCYDVRFEGFTWEGWAEHADLGHKDWFTCFEDELEAV